MSYPGSISQMTPISTLLGTEMIPAVYSGDTVNYNITAAVMLTYVQANPLKTSTVALLQASPTAGQLAYASNGRKQGEGAGLGTGVPVYFSSGQWRRFSDDTQVLA